VKIFVVRFPVCYVKVFCLVAEKMQEAFCLVAEKIQEYQSNRFRALKSRYEDCFFLPGSDSVKAYTVWLLQNFEAKKKGQSAEVGSWGKTKMLKKNPTLVFFLEEKIRSYREMKVVLLKE
jgi:hypothetical protein